MGEVERNTDRFFDQAAFNNATGYKGLPFPEGRVDNTPLRIMNYHIRLKRNPAGFLDGVL